MSCRTPPFPTQEPRCRHGQPQGMCEPCAQDPLFIEWREKWRTWLTDHPDSPEAVWLEAWEQRPSKDLCHVKPCRHDVEIVRRRRAEAHRTGVTVAIICEVDGCPFPAFRNGRCRAHQEDE